MKHLYIYIQYKNIFTLNMLIELVVCVLTTLYSHTYHISWYTYHSILMYLLQYI